MIFALAPRGCASLRMLTWHMTQLYRYGAWVPKVPVKPASSPSIYELANALRYSHIPRAYGPATLICYFVYQACKANLTTSPTRDTNQSGKALDRVLSRHPRSSRRWGSIL